MRRYDPGVLLSAIGRYLPQLASGGTDAMKLTGPFSKVKPAAAVLAVLLQSLLIVHACMYAQSAEPVRAFTALQLARAASCCCTSTVRHALAQHPYTADSAQRGLTVLSSTVARTSLGCPPSRHHSAVWLLVRIYQRVKHCTLESGAVMVVCWDDSCALCHQLQSNGG